MLSEAEIATYREKGWIVPDYRVPDALLAEAREAFDSMARERPDYADLYPDLLRANPRFFDIGRDPALLDILAQIMGPDIVLWTAAVFGKPAGQGKATPWHQDGEYWPIRPLETVTAWVALDASTPENGCLRVVPGSHKPRRLFRHERREGDYTLHQEVADSAVDPGQAEDIVLEPGQVSLHDVYLVHGSGPNRSPHRRAGITYRYMPAASHFDRALGARQHAELGVPDISRREIYLVHGRPGDNPNDYSQLPG